MYQQKGKRRLPLSPKAIVGIVLAVLALIFVFQNSDKRRVHLYVWTLDAPMWLWLIILLGVGFIVGSLFPWFRRSPKDGD